MMSEDEKKFLEARFALRQAMQIALMRSENTDHVVLQAKDHINDDNWQDAVVALRVVESEALSTIDSFSRLVDAARRLREHTEKNMEESMVAI